MTPVVRDQRQADAVYFDLSDPFVLVPRNMCLHKLSSCGFCDAYVSWFRSYLTNRQHRVRVSGTLSLTFQVTTGAVFCGLLFSKNSLITHVTLSTTVNF
jgi:hypothetical protein